MNDECRVQNQFITHHFFVSPYLDVSFVRFDLLWSGLASHKTEQPKHNHEDENGRDTSATKLPSCDAGDQSAQRTLHVSSPEDCSQLIGDGGFLKQMVGEVNRHSTVLCVNRWGRDLMVRNFKSHPKQI